MTITERLNRLLAVQGREFEASGPLAGIRVLDLSRVVAGPFAAMALGQLGASVVKLERTGSGDDARNWGPPFFAQESSYFLAVNSDKIGIEVDLSSADGQAIVGELSQWADVIVENFKDGTLEKWGIGLDDLRELNPRLVTASVRGYPIGDSRPGYDFIIQASSGLMSLSGPEDGPPSRVPIAIADLATGNFLVSGVLAALLERSTSGKGQHVEVSLWESQVALLTNIAQAHLLSGEDPPRMGNGHPHIEPYGLFECSDGVVALAATNDRQFDDLVSALGRPASLLVAEFSTNPARVRNRAQLQSALKSVLRTVEVSELLIELENRGVAAGPVRTTSEVFKSDEARIAGTVVTIPHTAVGALPTVRLPWNFSRTRSGPRRGAPTLGEHNEILHKEQGS